MSTNQNTNKNNNNEPSFDEYRAYEELRMIFVIAIETQNFEILESRISAWEKRYPLAEFQNPEIIRRIKAILNKDFLARLLGDYLASKILHEQEKQKELYDSLKEIIDKAKKTKDFKTANKEVRKWKDNLHSNGFSLYDFDRIYRARVCTLLLLPSKELKNQEQATDELKKIKENGNSMDSKTYFEAISNWQNTYSLTDFPDKLKKELNQITTEVFDSISQKRTSENAIAEIQLVLSSKDQTLPVDAIASILSKYDYRSFDKDTMSQIENLSMAALSLQESTFENADLSMLATISPAESQALTSLRDILNKTPNDTDKILNWIYVNRKICYSEFARNEILGQFLSAGYKIPEQNSYSIPAINPSLNYTDSTKIDEFRRNVILSYLGIISQGKKLSIEGKDNLADAHIVSTEETLAQKEDIPVMFLEAFDTVVDEHTIESELLYDEKGNLDIDEEEFIYNIFIEDFMDNPLATYSIKTPSIDKTSKDVTTQDSEQEHEHETDLQAPIPAEIYCEEIPLTKEDDENLEKAYELSTYICVALPILEQAHAQKKESPRKREKGVERIK